MKTQPQGGSRKPRAAVARWLRIALVCFLSGCQALPGRVATCQRPTILPRRSIAFHQIIVDTAVTTAERPVRSLGVLVAEPAEAARGAADGLHKRAMKLCHAPDPVPEDRSVLDVAALEEELKRVNGNELQPACIDLITDGDEALAALEEALKQATCRIDILMYLWDNDPLGWEVAKRVAESASEAVPVRILIDGGGNLLQGEPDNASASEVNAVVCWLSQQPHVHVIRTRNPFYRFDHRKLVLIDGRLIWSGGRNFTHEAFFEAHDLTYLMNGPLTGDMASRYEEFWRAQGGPPAPPPPAAVTPHEPNTMARFVRTRPYERDLANTVYAAVDRAKHHIYLENPYFSDNLLIVKLAQARRRGVDVRVVLTLDSGSTPTDIANRVIVNRLLAMGIRVYLYPGLLHVKALSVDGVWAYIGTGNFDPLSLRHNRELGVAVSHGSLVAELEERLFLPDQRPEWQQCEPLRLHGYEYFFEMFAGLFL